MSSKRSSSLSPSSPFPLAVGASKSPNKRARPRSSNQASIDSFFFKSPRTDVNPPAESFNSDSPASSSPSRPTQPSILTNQRPPPLLSSISILSLTPKMSQSCHSCDGQPPPQYPGLSVDPPSFVLNDTCLWPTDARAPYSFLVHALCTLSATHSRAAILNTLTNALRVIAKYHPPSLLPSLYLLSNSLAPPYVSIELGLGPSIISKAIQRVSGITPATLKRLYNQTGDPGDRSHFVPHAPLSIQAVYDALLNIAHVKGKGAVSRKQAIVEKLLVSAKGEETRYLVRTLSQHIRVGAVRTSILTALSRALVLTPPATLVAQRESSSRAQLLEKFAAAETLLKKVFTQHPNYDHIVSAIFEAGLDGLAERVRLTVGIPLQPTLGSPMRSLDDVYQRIGHLQFTAELKYDGQRVQIHAEKSDAGKISVSLFSRHLENMTEKYPDVVCLVHHLAISQEISSFIVDAEIVAVDASGDSLKSFQELSNRPRKDVRLHEIKVPVCVYAFDLMYLNGQSFLQEPFRFRRKLLRTHFPVLPVDEPGAAKFDHVESCESEGGRAAIEEFWLRAVDSRCEGLMIKLLDHDGVLEATGPRKDASRKQPLPATYEPDKRTSAWLKLKKDYVTGLGDTLDVVPIGAWHGNGRKAQWWSPVLLAVRDPSTETLVAICKCMSGFSDSFYRSMRNRYSEESENCSKVPLWEGVEAGGYSPSVYFRPHEVWEIRGADVTLSPVSVVAMGRVSEDRGLSLRFPRFIKVREDKSVEQASSTDFLVNMYQEQQGRGKNRGGAGDGQLNDSAHSDVVLDGDWEHEELDLY
ncbi:ATP-dependent DNA ligase [Multifurca ochricompacta]|uniref:DNA ligase n=1 Tax=Multifurca ochricompacta TaxID=376703 RepID=A0AAD4QQV0_9AGAM|nr:ATP-dependent DNA ligase [Multifurca ochricompacta]